MQNQPDKYGERYKEARKQRIQKKGYKSEVSGKQEETLHSHHTHPQSLGFFQYGDYRDSLLMVTKGEHEAVHMKIAKSKKYLQLIDGRIQVAKQLWRDPQNQTLKEKLREYDSQLIPAYIQGILEESTLSEPDKEAVIFHTLINSFCLNRDLMVDMHDKETEVHQLKNRIAELEAFINALQSKMKERINKVMLTNTPNQALQSWFE